MAQYVSRRAKSQLRKQHSSTMPRLRRLARLEGLPESSQDRQLQLVFPGVSTHWGGLPKPSPLGRLKKKGTTPELLLGPGWTLGYPARMWWQCEPDRPRCPERKNKGARCRTSPWHLVPPAWQQAQSLSHRLHGHQRPHWSGLENREEEGVSPSRGHGGHRCGPWTWGPPAWCHLEPEGPTLNPHR